MNREELLEALHYNPKTGIFVWVKSRSRKGKVAGSKNSRGYILIRFNRGQYYAHRLAWFYVYGYWPNNIDHINRDPSDNRIENLRDCTQKENLRNTGLWSTNTSGIRGVYKTHDGKKWRAAIIANDINYYLGVFSTKKEAAKARKEAEKKLYGEEQRS